MTSDERWFRAVRKTMVLVVVALSSLLFAAGSGLANANDDQLDRDGLSWSTDGKNFGSALPTPLIPAGVRLAPGEAERSRVWVRNDTGADGQVTLLVNMADQAAQREELLDSGSVVLGGQIGDSDWRAVHIKSSDRIMALGSLEAGESAPLTVRLALSPEAPPGVTFSGSDAKVLAGFTGDTDGAAATGLKRFVPSGAGLSGLLVPVGLLVLAAGALALNRPPQLGPVGVVHERPSSSARAFVVDDVDDVDGVYDGFSR